MASAARTLPATDPVGVPAETASATELVPREDFVERIWREAPAAHSVQVVDGPAYVQPRPRPVHARVAGRLGARLDGPFDLGSGGPGGWIILIEPELHLGEDKVIPDLAGWRRDRQ